MPVSESIGRPAAPANQPHPTVRLSRSDVREFWSAIHRGWIENASSPLAAAWQAYCRAQGLPDIFIRYGVVRVMLHGVDLARRFGQSDAAFVLRSLVHRARTAIGLPPAPADYSPTLAAKDLPGFVARNLAHKLASLVGWPGLRRSVGDSRWLQALARGDVRMEGGDL